MISTRPRSGFVIKSFNSRSLAASRVDKNQYFESSQSRVSGSSIIEQFRIHRGRYGESIDKNVDVDSNDFVRKIRRRIFYIKKQKLGTISYAKTTWQIKKNGFTHFINKYVAVKNLGIITTMFRQWLKNGSEIEKVSKKTKKMRVNNIDCQESDMENRLIELFVKTKKMNCKITNRWFFKHAKQIYEKLHFHRIFKRSSQFVEYNEFRFFHDWFVGFKKRRNVCVRMSTKISQIICRLKFSNFWFCWL